MKRGGNASTRAIAVGLAMAVFTGGRKLAAGVMVIRIATAKLRDRYREMAPAAATRRLCRKDGN